MTPIAFPAEAAPVPISPSAPAPQDQARKERAAEKARSAAQALDTLKRARKAVGSDRKAAAKQKLEALKHRLQQLRMLGATPAQIAQIAKALAAAVKDYAAAGGTATEGSLAPSPTPPTQAQPETGAQAQAEAPAAVAQDAEAGAGDPKDPKAETPYDKALRALQDDSARMIRRADAHKEDNEFISEARRLAKALKAAAEEAERRARQSKDPAAADEAKQAAKLAEEAVIEAERALQDAAGAAGGVGIALSV